MITIKNRVTKIKINQKKISAALHKMLTAAGYQNFDIGVLFTTNATIKKFNKTYRHKNKPTDILSFPYHTTLKAGQKIVVKSPEDENLGDIIISLEYVQNVVKQEKLNFDEHMNVLLAHGVAHLLGYDHETDQEFKVMQKKERQLLAAL